MPCFIWALSWWLLGSNRSAATARTQSAETSRRGKEKVEGGKGKGARKRVWGSRGRGEGEGGLGGGRCEEASLRAAPGGARFGGCSQGPSLWDSCMCRTHMPHDNMAPARICPTRPAHTSDGSSHAATSRSSDCNLMRGGATQQGLVAKQIATTTNRDTHLSTMPSVSPTFPSPAVISC